MGKSFWFLLAVLVFIILLFASTFFIGPARVNSEPDKSFTTLTMLIDNQQDLSGYQQVSEISRETIGIEIEFETRPAGAEGDDLLKSRLSSRNMTDLNFYNSGSLFRALNLPANFLDLSHEPFMDRVLDSFKETVSLNDMVFAVPASTMMAGGWFYNNRVYDQLGLEVPRTWDELLANCRAVSDAGLIPVVTPFADSWTAQMVVLGDYYNLHNSYPGFAEAFSANRISFSETAAAVDGFQKLRDLYTEGFYTPEPENISFEEGLSLLAGGDAVHFPMLSFGLSLLAEMNPEAESEIGFFPQPGRDAADQGATLWMPVGISVYRESLNTLEAREWLDFFLSSKGISALMMNHSPQGPFAVKDIDLPENRYQAVRDLMPYIESGRSVAALEFLAPVKGPGLPDISLRVGTGGLDPLAAAKEYDLDVAKQAKYMNLAGWR